MCDMDKQTEVLFRMSASATLPWLPSSGSLDPAVLFCKCSLSPPGGQMNRQLFSFLHCPKPGEDEETINTNAQTSQ